MGLSSAARDRPASQSLVCDQRPTRATAGGTSSRPAVGRGGGELSRSLAIGSDAGTAGPLGWAQHGVIQISPRLGPGALRREVMAHEAVHVAQQRSTSPPTTDRRALEHEAHLGSRNLAEGRPFEPRLSAPPSLALGYDPFAWFPEPTGQNDREVAALAQINADPARTNVRTGMTSQDGGWDAPSELRYRLEVDGSGSRGTVMSTTEVVVRRDPHAQVMVTVGPQLQQLGPETGLYRAEPRPAYPYTVSYTRHLVYADEDGRHAEVDLRGTVWFSEQRWAQQTRQVAQPSFDGLLNLTGDVGSMRATVSGAGPVTSYFFVAEVRGDGVSAQSLTSTTASGIAGGASARRHGITSTAEFVEAQLTAGDQHASLRRLLTMEDVAVITDRLMAQSHAEPSSWLDSALSTLADWLAPVGDALDDLGEAVWDALPRWLQDDIIAFGEAVAGLAQDLADLVGALAGSIEAWWDELPPWARGVLKAIGAFAGGLAAVAALAGLIVLAAEGAVAFGTAMMVVGAIALGVGFVSSVVSRGQEALATDPLALLAVPSIALMDVIGVSGIFEGVTNTSILTGRPLRMSEEDRWERGTTGVLQLGTLILGARGFRGGRVPPTVEPIEITFTGPRTGFDGLPTARLPRNLPEGYAWRRAGSQWELVRDPTAPAEPVEISTFDDGTGTPNYVVRVNGRAVSSDTVPRPPNDTFQGPQRLPEVLEGTGADNPFLTEDGVLMDKGHLGDFADTPEGPGVRSQTLAPENYTPQAAWWNRWVRNNLVRRIRLDGNGYRELPVYDASPPRTVNGTPIPREYVFMETRPDGTPVRAWRIPNDPTITTRSQSVLPQYEMAPGDIPQVMLRPDGTAVPPGTRINGTLVVGSLGPGQPDEGSER